MKARAERELPHEPARVQIDHDMNLRPDETAHEIGDAVRDAAERRPAGAVDEGAIEIDAIVQSRIAGSGLERRHVEHWNEDDAPVDGFDVDVAHQMADRDRPFIFVAVIGAERDQPLSRLGFRSDHHRQRNEMIAPDRIMFERDVIVAAALRFEIELVWPDDQPFHAITFS